MYNSSCIAAISSVACIWGFGFSGVEKDVAALQLNGGMQMDSKEMMPRWGFLGAYGLFFNEWIGGW